MKRRRILLSQKKNSLNFDQDSKHEMRDVTNNFEDEKVLLNSDINSLSEDELISLRKFLFDERIRIIQEQEEQKAVYEKFLKERLSFQEEMKALNLKVLSERKRLKDENLFFEKKMQILQNGFLQLDLERRNFEKERKIFEQNKILKENGFKDSFDLDSEVPDFFRGVNSLLGLKKRYRDLLKIFHPDNLCGDKDTVLEITKQYDSIRNKM